MRPRWSASLIGSTRGGTRDVPAERIIAARVFQCAEISLRGTAILRRPSFEPENGDPFVDRAQVRVTA